MNLDNLWIGDWVQLIKSKRVGKFAGIDKTGKARINIDGKVILSKSNNLSSYTPPEKEDKLEFNPKEKIQIATCPKEIDLHIEKLNPSLVNGQPERILDYQIKSLKSYLERCKAQHLSHATIIHGKGTGVLRQEVEHLLKMTSGVKINISVNQGGATEVYFD